MKSSQRTFSISSGEKLISPSPFCAINMLRSKVMVYARCERGAQHHAPPPGWWWLLYLHGESVDSFQLRMKVSLLG